MEKELDVLSCSKATSIFVDLIQPTKFVPRIRQPGGFEKRQVRKASTTSPVLCLRQAWCGTHREIETALAISPEFLYHVTFARLYQLFGCDFGRVWGQESLPIELRIGPTDVKMSVHEDALSASRSSPAARCVKAQVVWPVKKSLKPPISNPNVIWLNQSALARTKIY